MSRQRCTAWVHKLCAAGSGPGHRGPAQAESDTATLHEIIRLLSASSGMVKVECQQEAEAAHLSASSGMVEVECQQEQKIHAISMTLPCRCREHGRKDLLGIWASSL